MDRLADLLLRLYPRSFRDRFAAEWREMVAWRRARLGGARAASVRLIAALLVDAARVLPGAYAAMLVRTGRGLGTALGDVRHAVRSLSRSPAFALCAVASLALGIGANAAVFSVVDAVLIEALPYRNADRLTMVWMGSESLGRSRLPLSPVEVADLGAEPGLFESVGGVWAKSATVSGLDEAPEQVPAGLVTPDFLSVLGVSPALGRDFIGDSTGVSRPEGVIISHELWQARYGGDPGIIGRLIRVDGVSTPVVGVLPERFRLLLPPDASIPERLDVYTSLPWNLAALPPGNHYLRVVGRLRPGVDLAEAQQSVEVVAARLRSTYAEIAETGDRLSVLSLQEDSVRKARPVLFALSVGVGLFLLLAAANVASLVLARATTRRQELAVRASMGATRGRLCQFALAESVVIGIAGAIGGLGLAHVGTSVLWKLRPSGITGVDSVPLDGTVIVFTLCASLAVTLLFGLAPLPTIFGADLTGSFRRGDPRTVARSSARRWITIGEIAIGLVLLAGASLMGQTLANLRHADLGFPPEHLLTFKLALAEQRFPTDDERARLAEEIERRVADLPGVSAVGATSHVPMGHWANWADAAPPEGVPELERQTYFADHRSVTPGFFSALGATLVEGRFFDEGDDTESAPVVIIDRSMAQRAFPDGDAVGSTLHASRYVAGDFVPTPAIVVGVVEDIRDASPGRSSTGQVFWPFAQSARWELTWVVRTLGSKESVLPRIREQVAAVSPDLAVADVAAMDELLKSATADTGFVALLGGVFSLLAVGLAALGLYGVVTYTATQRRREFGMRRALGASRDRILLDVVREGVELGAIGVMAGLATAVLVTRFLGTLLYGTSPTNPLTLGGVGALFMVVAVCASLVPALRATNVDPAVSIRE